MPTIEIKNLGGINTYVNPALQGQLIHSVNFDSFPFGAKTKRAGYTTYLGTADGSVPTSMFNWTKNDGTFFNYRTSGSAIYYSTQGTGTWTLCGNGTITAGNKVGHAVLDDTLVVGENAGSTRHTTSGTSFTNTTIAPVGEFLEQYQGRIYVGGTSSTLFYSTTNDATNWATSGTSDSSSLTIPGAGKMGRIFKSADRLITSKTSGLMHRWDGYSLVDMSTNLGPSSPYSADSQEGYYFWLNRLGVYGYGGNRPQILSNAIQNQIYNNSGSAIVGTEFDTAPGVAHRYNYYASVGTLTDDLVNETIDDAIIKYNFQKNEFLNYSLAVKPTSWLSYKDASGVDQLVFGGTGGQCYTLGGTNLNDNGSAIVCNFQYVVHLGTFNEKQWYWLRALFNPGNQARVQIATSNSFVEGNKKWIDIGNASSGVLEERFPTGSQSRFLFIRVTESSQNSRLSCYGFEIDAEIVKR